MANYSNKIIQFAQKLSQKKGYRIELITTPMIERKYKLLNARSNITPYEWVALFNDASYVITDSFHGVAFSLNFNKQVYIDLEIKGCKTTSRIKNIIDNFHLEKNVLNGDISQMV